MYQRQCRLTIADKFYGGGGPDIPQRSPGAEWQDIKKFGTGNINQYEKFTQRDPLLRGLYGRAQEEVTGGPSDLLARLQGIATSQLDPANYGRLTPEEAAGLAETSRAGAAARGMATTLPGLGTELLDRYQYTRGREKEAQQFGAQVEGLSEGDITRRLAAGTGVLGAGVQAYTGLTNPIIAWLSDLFSSNQNAAAAESIAGSNKSSGTASGAISGITSVIGGIAAAY